MVVVDDSGQRLSLALVLWSCKLKLNLMLYIKNLLKNKRVVLVTASPRLPWPVAMVALLAVLLVVMLPHERKKKKKLGSKLKSQR